MQEIIRYLNPVTIEAILLDLFKSQEPHPKELLHSLFAALVLRIGEPVARLKFPEFDEKIVEVAISE